MEAETPYGCKPSSRLRKILRGTAANRTIIMVGASAWLEWWVFRLSPSLGLWLSKLRARRFQAGRRSS